MRLKKVFSLEEKSFVEKIKIVQQWYCEYRTLGNRYKCRCNRALCDSELEKYRVTSLLDQLNAAVITTG